MKTNETKLLVSVVPRVHFTPRLFRPVPSYAHAPVFMQYAPSVETVDLSAADVVVATLGWIVTFPSEVSSTPDTVPASGSGGLAVDLAEETDLWAWWVWLIYGLLVACCLMPLCCFLCRR